MRPNRWGHLLFAAFVGVAIYLVAIPDAHAVPSFSRKYKTSCQTCHTVYPALNAFGEAFRRNGYRFPSKDGSLDSDVEKAAPIELGQEQYKQLFPDAVWPDKILEAVPLSVWLNGGVPMNIPGSDAHTAAGNTFTWSGIEAEMHIFGAGAFSDNLTYMTQLTLESDFGSPAGTFDIETAYLLWNDIVGPSHLLNLWVGRLFAPQLTSYGLHSSYLSDTLMPGVSVSGLYNPSAGFTLGHGHYDGIEVNGIAEHRFGYSLGWMASTAATGVKSSNAEDVYAHIGYKLGGLALDGEGSNTPAADTKKPWEETAVTFDLFGYHGLTRLTNGTDTVPGGPTTSAVTQDDRISALGGMVHAQVGSLIVVSGLQLEHHNRPYPGAQGTPNPSGGVFNGAPDYTSATAVVQYNEVNYIVWPWFVPGVRTEYTHATVEGSSAAQLMRIIPGIAMLVRPNIRVVVTGDVEWRTNMPPVGGWDAAGGIINASGAASRIEAEQINATFGVGF